MIRSKKTASLLSLLVILLGVGLLRTDLLKIDQVQWVSKNATCLNLSQVSVEVNLKNNYFFSLDEPAILKKVSLKYPCVKNLMIERKLPKGLKITAEGRVPLVKIAFLPKIALEELVASPSSATALLDWAVPESVDLFYLADKEGYVFDQDQSADLPILYQVGDEIKLGQKTEDHLTTTIEQLILVLKRLDVSAQDSMQFQFKKVGNSLLVYSTPRLVFSLKSDFSKQLGSLQLILQKAKIDEEAIEMVDLRFDKPVVVYSLQI